MKKISCIFLVVLLLITSTVPALAAATPSNSDFRLEDYLDNYKKIPLPADNPGLGVVPDFPVHTSSDADVWIGDDGLPVADSDDRLLTDDIMPFVVNRIVGYASDNKGTLYPVVGAPHQIFNFPTLTDGKYYKSLYFQIRKSEGLPNPGTYKIRMFLNDAIGNVRNTGIDNIQADYFKMSDSSVGVAGNFTGNPTVVDKTGKRWQLETTVQIDYNTQSIAYNMDFYQSAALTQLSIGIGDMSFWFDSTTEPTISAGGNGSAQDHIANQSSQIAQNTATMNDTLKEIVQTISKQLEALWNQQYNYIHLEDMANADKNADKIIANQDENTSIVTDAIEEHGNFIIEGLKRLFIPSDEFFKEYFDDLYNWFSDKFGFLTIPIDILIQILDVFTTSQKVDFIVTLPPLSIMGETVWPEQSFNFTDFMEKDFAFLITAIQTGTSILLILSFIDLCRKKYDEVMRN